ncbi:hypothetical protein [Nitrobacter vulgaris]|uniref:Uncharacterized protein n=1 Tax=Nitrobacter vulgaris TaxID=29421 RepID=A0A1V4HZA0_NITVU|nr:hypothetical protein [Nitrobacter vulgaris]OPH82902.1 hypothetical protein B2M20_10285 [Nitrobacter vulgaris]
MTDALFRSLDSAAIARDIRKAQHSVCYAAPGIQQEPAKAMAELARRIGPELITVCLDFDERVMRMGFGDLAAVKTLLDAGIAVSSTPGLRTGLVIVDHDGFIFTPTALYLEADERPTEAPNALRLSRDQVTEALARLSPAAKAIAMVLAKTPAERERIREQAVEVPSTVVMDVQFAAIQTKLAEAPPVQFDVARQVRVFEPYFQYVELRLTGAAIHRHRIAIPKVIQNFGADESVQSRLKTTFDLIERESALSSKPIEDELNTIRKNLTHSLGKDHGRVLSKAQKPLFEKRLSELRAKLEKFQTEVRSKLQEKLDSSRDEIVKYYVTRVVENPPDAFAGQLLTEKPTEDDARRWLGLQLDRVFPKAEQLIQKMDLEQTYKDVTFETLNKPDFLSCIKVAFPGVNWDRAYEEYRAAGEKKA